jgi:hypothetical protein
MHWVEVDREAVRGKQEFEGLDPYATWALGEAGRKHLCCVDAVRAEEEPYQFQVLIELKNPGTIGARDLADGTPLASDPQTRQRWQASVFIPPAYTHPPSGITHVKHLTATVGHDFFELLASHRDILATAIARVTLSRPVPRRAMAAGQAAAQLAGSQTSKHGTLDASVLVGSIDDGIAFGHECFRNADGTTRIESIWLQDGDPPSAFPFDYGRVICKRGPRGIDDLLTQSGHAGLIDEDKFYSLAKVVDFARVEHKPVAFRRAHGTHVLDLAAGGKPGEGPDWPIVCVQLPVATTADTSGASLAVLVVDGIWHILLRSLEISSRPLPVVINLSHGTIAGPHDGTSHLERAIDDITALWQEAFGVPVQVVTGSGNSHLARVHARIDKRRFQDDGSCVELPWRIQPDDRTPSYVEVWLPHRDTKLPSPIELSVVAPNGLESPIVGRGGTAGSKLVSADGVLCQVTYEYACQPTRRGVFLIVVGPTAALGQDGHAAPVAPSGVWRLRLRDASLKADEYVNAWIQRDDTPYGYPTVGRQSYFDDPHYRRFDEAGREIEVDHASSIVRRAGTMNAIATGESTAVIGGVLRKELRPAPYSSGGPVERRFGSTRVHRTGPEALAVSDDSLVLAGILAAGTRSGSVVAMNGTSVAAPLVTRWIAQQLAAGESGDRRAVAQFAGRDTLPGKPSVERGGAGRILTRPRTVRRTCIE